MRSASATWTAFRWNEGIIRIEATQFFRPKTHDSEGDVLVDSELLEIFRGYHARAKGEFVIESAVPADPAALYDITVAIVTSGSDRLASLEGCHFKDAIAQLAQRIRLADNARYGLTAAQEMLRHADIG